MQLLADDLAGLTGAIWASVLGREVQACPMPADEVTAGHTVTACVHITGGWTGSVEVALPTDLAHVVAAEMFGLEVAGLTREDVRDAVGEIANIAGGNIKGMIDEPCELSLPVVAEGASYVVALPGTQVTSTAVLSSDGIPFCIRLHSAA
jgi:chemotaxis protein CheX